VALRHNYLANAGHCFALALEKFGLGVKRIDLARPAITEDRNAVLRLGGEMRADRPRRAACRQQSLVREDVGECETCHTAAQLLK
jgi:hypothetical protein